MIPRPQKYRSHGGFSIVEALIALVLAALVSAAFIDFFSQLMRTNSATVNEITANSINQTLQENLRGLDYEFLVSQLGKFELKVVNPPFESIISPAVKPGLLLEDFIDKKWSSTLVASKFRGKAFVNIEPSAVIPDALLITTVVEWSDSARTKDDGSIRMRSVKRSFTVTKNGVSKWKS